MNIESHSSLGQKIVSAEFDQKKIEESKKATEEKRKAFELSEQVSRENRMLRDELEAHRRARQERDRMEQMYSTRFNGYGSSGTQYATITSTW